MEKNVLQRFRVLSAAGVLVVAIVACSQGSDDKKSTQVAAVVNEDEITIHQINRALSRVPNANPETTVKIKREILDRLINQQLTVQQASEKRLDRTPNVVQAIEAAKAEIIARAYLEQITAAVPKPTDEEVKKYYADHPELFSQRRIYHLQEVVALNAQALAAPIKGATKGGSIDAVVSLLRARNIPFSYNERIMGAEELPIASLPQFQKLKEGETQVNETPERIALVKVVSIRSAPVSEAAAAPRIRQFLITQRANQAAAEEIKRLRSVAKIQYRGEFAEGAASSEQPRAPIAPKPSTVEPHEKGLKGLR